MHGLVYMDCITKHAIIGHVVRMLGFFFRKSWGFWGFFCLFSKIVDVLPMLGFGIKNDHTGTYIIWLIFVAYVQCYDRELFQQWYIYSLKSYSDLSDSYRATVLCT